MFSSGKAFCRSFSSRWTFCEWPFFCPFHFLWVCLRLEFLNFLLQSIVLDYNKNVDTSDWDWFIYFHSHFVIVVRADSMNIVCFSFFTVKGHYLSPFCDPCQSCVSCELLESWIDIFQVILRLSWSVTLGFFTTSTFQHLPCRFPSSELTRCRYA